MAGLPRALIQAALPSPRRRPVSLSRGGDFIVSTDKHSIDVGELGALLAATGQNCHQFPRIRGDGSVVAVDRAKLRRALDFSDIAVAIYIRGRSIPGGDYMERVGEDEEGVWDRIFSDKGSRCLVAFGRAVSDKTLAGSIHDVAHLRDLCSGLLFTSACFPGIRPRHVQVAPSMQRRGLGRHVLQRLSRHMYYTQDIADISVLTRPENLPFFATCGFKPDALCSTTMLYTEAPPVSSKTYHEATSAGKMTLLVPAPSVKANFSAF